MYDFEIVYENNLMTLNLFFIFLQFFIHSIFFFCIFL